MNSKKSDRPDAGGGVRVKPLEWVERVGVTGTFDANTSIGLYIASITDDGRGHWFILGLTTSNFTTANIEAVKAAAQADYERRILSALSTPPAAAESNASVEERLRTILAVLNSVAPAAENLACNQEQADMDGCMVKVSRQALDEVLAAVNEVAIQVATSDCSAGGDEANKSEGGKKETIMTEDQIKHMVNRFLGWTLPENFNPDGGVSFKRLENRYHHPEAPPFYPMPTGTNLFDAMQADAMVRYMIDGMPTPSDPPDRREIVARLNTLARYAFNEGFVQGMREETSCCGGETWDEFGPKYEKAILAALDGGAGA